MEKKTANYSANRLCYTFNCSIIAGETSFSCTTLSIINKYHCIGALSFFSYGIFQPAGSDDTPATDGRTSSETSARGEGEFMNIIKARLFQGVLYTALCDSEEPSVRAAERKDDGCRFRPMRGFFSSLWRRELEKLIRVRACVPYRMIRKKSENSEKILMYSNDWKTLWKIDEIYFRSEIDKQTFRSIDGKLNDS